MNEQAPNNPDYLEHHPDAIQDPELAHKMALAGAPDEAEAARLRQFAEVSLQNTIVKDPGNARVRAALVMNEIVPKINRLNSRTNQTYAEIEMKPHDFAADARASLKATKR